ncbi:MAG: SDR family NAD(P)-dependent oxidoreductase [bacterium]|nr:SDR family NAD(P)-dependent oxidoreductase [bacterium]
MMNVVVTGGAGFIGSTVCEALLARGDSVICIDNFNDYYNPEAKEEHIKEMQKNPDFKLYRTDICDSAAMEKLFSENKIDKIIHLAARAGVRASLENPLLYEEVNLKGTLIILELARKNSIKNIIFGSSSSIYGNNEKVPFSEEDRVDNPISPYAATKRAAELMCFAYHNLYKMNITCLRFFTVYGPRGRPDMAIHKFTRFIEEEKDIELYGSGTSRDYTFISDIVAGILAALDKELEFEIINLGDSNPVELNYLVELIESAVGKKAKIKKSGMQMGDVNKTYANISKAKKLLGYEPTVKIEEGIKKFVEWYKNERTVSYHTGI